MVEMRVNAVGERFSSPLGCLLPILTIPYVTVFLDSPGNYIETNPITQRIDNEFFRLNGSESEHIRNGLSTDGLEVEAAA